MSLARLTVSAILLTNFYTMQFIPIKTRTLQPPQDDLLAVLDESVPALQNGDVVLISSKVVAIHEGRCVPADTADKAALITQDADVVIERDYWNTPLTIIHNYFVSSAGIDQSNGNGYLVLLPEDPFRSAHDLHTYLCTKYALTELGIIVTDSRSLPLRYGATGVAIGWWGITPLESHIGETDLFGRVIRSERSNVVDGLAAGATVVMGEVAECTPLVIARDVPNLTFTSEPTRDELFASFTDDTFRILYDRFLS